MQTFTCLSCGLNQQASNGGANGCSKCGGELAQINPIFLTAEAPKRRLPEEVEKVSQDPSRCLGPYILTEKLGQGGMGEVWRAYHKDLGGYHAVKLYQGRSQKELARFQSEARSMATLIHPGIVRVHDVHEISGRHYYSMDLIEGPSLADVLSQQRLPVRTVMQIIREICQALQYAHDRKIIHRDIKPANILLARLNQAEEGTVTLSGANEGRYRVMIADFGLAKDLDAEDSLTASGEIFGTPHYMSPEQAEDPRTTDARSDVYSVGAVAYQMLTGVPPAQGATIFQVIEHIKHGEPTPVTRLVPDVSKEAALITHKALEKNPQRRYPTALAMAQDIERYLNGEAILAKPPSTLYRLRKWAYRHRAAMGVSLGAMLLTAALVFVLSILPAWREESKDWERLKEAVAQKHEKEKSFSELVGAGRLDEAIALGESMYDRLPPVPERLHDPRRAAQFPELGKSYAVTLAGVYLERGRRRLASGHADGMADCVSAYRLALKENDVRTGLEALDQLGRGLEAKGDRAGALRVYRLCEGRFGASAGMVARMAALYELEGELEEAWVRWKRLEHDANFSTRARAAIRVLRSFLPRRRTALGEGSVYAMDTDGNGSSEIVHVSPPGRLTVFRWEGAGLSVVSTLSLREYFDQRVTAWRVWAVDVDGDGRSELVVGGGNPVSGIGAVVIVRVLDRALEVAGYDRTHSFVKDVDVGDVDGDGGPELLVTVGYYESSVRAYKLSGGAFTRVGVWQIPCAPDWARWTGNRRLLMQWGGWLKTDGWRTYVMELGLAGKYRVIGKSAERFASNEAVRVDEGSYIVLVARYPEVVNVVPDILPSGIYRLEVNRDSIGNLRPLTEPFPDRPSMGQLMRFGSFVAFVQNGELQLVRADAREIESRPRFALGNEALMVVGDVDGDSEPELLVHRGEVLEVWGMGSIEEVGSRPGIAFSAEGGRASPGEDMLQVKLYAEAERVFRKDLEAGGGAREQMGLGMALLGQGRNREAAEAFAAAARDRSYAREAGMRRAYALQCVRDWRGLVEALTWLEVSGVLDAYGEVEVSKWKAWATAAAQMSGREKISEWGGSIPLMCENPMEVRRMADGLEMRATSRRALGAGVGLHYDGGPLRLRFRFSMEPPKWGTTVQLGIIRTERLGREVGDGDARPGPWMFWSVSAGGVVEAPVRNVGGSARSRDGRAAGFGFDPNQHVPQEGREYELEMEYIPGLHRVIFVMRDMEAGEVVYERPLEMPFEMEKGMYAVGLWRPATQGGGGGGLVSRIVIRSVEVEAASAGTRARGLEGATARETMLTASGRVVLGELEAARTGYDAAIEMARREGDGETLWKAQLFRAVANVRQGRRAEARRDVRAAMGVPGNEVRDWLEWSSGGLTKEERRVLKGAMETEEY